MVAYSLTLNASHSEMLGQQGGLWHAWLHATETTCSEFRRKQDLLQKAGGCQHLRSSSRTGQRLCWGNLAHTWGGSRKQDRGQHPAETPRRRAQMEPWPLAPAVPLTLPSVGICFISESTAEASTRRACSRACSLASGKTVSGFSGESDPGGENSSKP